MQEQRKRAISGRRFQRSRKILLGWYVVPRTTFRCATREITVQYMHSQNMWFVRANVTTNRRREIHRNEPGRVHLGTAFPSGATYKPCCSTCKAAALARCSGRLPPCPEITPTVSEGSETTWRSVPSELACTSSSARLISLLDDCLTFAGCSGRPSGCLPRQQPILRQCVQPLREMRRIIHLVLLRGQR